MHLKTVLWTALQFWCSGTLEQSNKKIALLKAFLGNVHRYDYYDYCYFLCVYGRDTQGGDQL